jgi:hypothetical protein
MSEWIYDAIMETLNPSLWLSDQEVQIELNRIAEQTRTKLPSRPADVADFSVVKQIAKEPGR